MRATSTDRWIRAGGMRLALLAFVLVLALALAASTAEGRRLGGAPTPSGPSVPTEAGTARPYGVGATQVWVLTPHQGAPRNVVVFLHGWGANLPFYWHLKWLDHLLSRGSAVIFPNYQAGSDDDPLISAPWNLEDGLRAGFRALGRPGLPVVAAGFSVGATLSFFYAANARAWGVPRPQAVFSVFPVDPVQIDPLRLPPPLKARTRILIMVGDRDTTVGRLGADALWRWLRSEPKALKEYRVVRSTSAFLADHEAPTNPLNPAVRRSFWWPLDTLVAWARDR